MDAKDRITNCVRIADLGVEIARLEHELRPHLQRLDALRQEYQQALQAHAESADSADDTDDVDETPPT